MPEPVKLIMLLRPDQPAQAWQDRVAGALASGVSGLQRLVFNAVTPIDVRTGEDRPPPYPAIIEAWFAHRADADAFAGRIDDDDRSVHLIVAPLLIHDSGRRPLPNKIMVTLKGRADLTREQAQRHWRTRHVEVGLIEHNATEFLRLYIQNHVIATNQPHGSGCDYDGMPEYWVDPADLASLGADAAVMKAIAADERLFADQSTIITMMMTEHEMFVATGTVGGWPVRESPVADVWRS